MSEGPFRRSTARWILGVCVASFLGGLLLVIFAPDIVPVSSGGQDSYSSAPLGHLGFAAVLQEVGIPTLSSRHASAERATNGSVLVVAAPPSQGVRDLLAEAERVLLVLPKWELHRAYGRNDRTAWVELLAAEEPGRVLKGAGVEGTVARTRGAPGAWTGDTLGGAPTFPVPVVQCLQMADLMPLLACPTGTLVGERVNGDRHLIVLSDPDLLCNAGIHLENNALLLTQLVERLRQGDGTVIIDETLHGHAATPSIWRELFSFPLSLVLLHALLVVVVTLAAGMGRFGAPAPEPPSVEPGQRFLIRSTAELLRHGGHTQSVLARYLADAMQAVRAALWAPAGLTGPELVGWLDHVAEARGAGDRVGGLRAAVQKAHDDDVRTSLALEAARRIHHWKEEMVHGHRSRS